MLIMCFVSLTRRKIIGISESSLLIIKPQHFSKLFNMLLVSRYSFILLSLQILDVNFTVFINNQYIDTSLSGHTCYPSRQLDYKVKFKNYWWKCFQMIYRRTFQLLFDMLSIFFLFSPLFLPHFPTNINPLPVKMDSNSTSFCHPPLLYSPVF